MPVIKSMLDEDLYKLTMQQAVLHLYPDVEVEYQFTDRSPTGKMGEAFLRELRNEIDAMADLKLQTDEADFLSTLPFLHKEYIEYLRNYRYNPVQVKTKSADGRLDLSIKGRWAETILWEVPLMAAISEVYFRHNTDGWRDDDLLAVVEENTKVKGVGLQGLRFTDFGTRRRRSYEVQDLVVDTLKKYDGFQGTSNVHLAHKYGLRPIGTMAHEWIMGVSAMEGLNRANWHALDKWNEVYQGNLGIALTDTFGTGAFWKDFNGQLARLYDGVRHDSGCPYKFTDDAIAHYLNLGIYLPGKTLVYSDGLNTSLCLDLAQYVKAKPAKEQISVAFGIGTHLTNDIPESPALKIVIKLRRCNGRDVVKLGDGVGKETGERDAVRVVKYVFFGTPLDS